MERRPHHARSSRAWLVAAGIAALTAVGAAVLHSRTSETVDETAFTRRGIAVRHLTLESTLVHRTMPVIGLVPAGAVRRPLLVFLHGRGGNERSQLNESFAAALVSLGDRAPIVVFPYGGDHSYWHDRQSGDWAKYILDEVIPLAVTSLGADRDRVAIGGISMGGFGAYDLARLNPGRFCAAYGSSPALWTRAGDTADGAFDNAADFARHDLIGTARSSASRFGGLKLWMDSGTSDPFRQGQAALVAALRAGGVGIESTESPGGHDATYWHAHYRDGLAAAVAGCSAAAVP